MTEPKVALTFNGQAVQKDDFNLIAKQAARAVDYAIWELYRSCAGNGSGVIKQIIPVSGAPGFGDSLLENDTLVYSSASNNAKVRVNVFTALISSNSLASVSLQEALRDIRTVTHFGNQGNNTFYTELQFAASTNKRFDLVWARVDVDVADPNVNRFVKDSDGNATSQSVSLTTRTTITIGVTQGVESAGTPAHPALPADSASVYYLPLAYIWIRAGHTLTTKIPGYAIHEVFSPAAMATAHGIPSLRPADSCYRIDGATLTNETWNGAGATVKPKTYLPPVMQGGESRLIPLCMEDSVPPVNVPANAITVIDASVNWRKRMFKMVVAGRDSANDGFPWTFNPGTQALWDATDTGSAVATRVGSSFFVTSQNAALNTFTGGAVTNGSPILLLDSATYLPALGAGAKMALYVDNTSGEIKCWRNATDAHVNLFIWLDATAPYHNNDADSL